MCNLNLTPLANDGVPTSCTRACVTLSEFTTLTNLDLASCFLVSDVGLRALATLPCLRSLDIKRIHRITDEGLHALTRLPALEHIDLRCDVQITDQGVSALRALTQLKTIDFRLCSKVTSQPLYLPLPFSVAQPANFSKARDSIAQRWVLWLSWSPRHKQHGFA